MKSKFLSLEIKDALRSFLLAVIGTILMGVYKIIEQGAFPVTWAEWKPIVLTGIGAGIAYIIKNWLTNSDDKLLKKELKKAA